VIKSSAKREGDQPKTAPAPAADDLGRPAIIQYAKIPAEYRTMPEIVYGKIEASDRGLVRFAVP